VRAAGEDPLAPPAPGPAAGPVSGPSAETAGPVLTMPGAPPAFHVMAKPTGAVCNLDCELG